MHVCSRLSDGICLKCFGFSFHLSHLLALVVGGLQCCSVHDINEFARLLVTYIASHQVISVAQQVKLASELCDGKCICATSLHHNYQMLENSLLIDVVMLSKKQCTHESKPIEASKVL